MHFMSSLKEILLIITLVMCSFSGGMEFNIFAPSLSQMQHDLRVGQSFSHWLITLGAIAFSISCFVTGSLEDRFTKRNILLCGVFIFSIGSLICYASNNYLLVLIGRVIQGIGGAAPIIAGVGIIVKNFSVKKQGILITLLSGSVSIGYSLSPIVGIYLSKVVPWYDDFLVLFLIGMISLLMAYFFVPKDELDAVKNKKFLEYFTCYKEIILNKKIILYVSIGFLPSAAFGVFFLASPLLFLQNMKMNASLFGNWESFNGLFFALMAFLGVYMFKKVGILKSIRIGMLSGIVYCLITFFVSLFYDEEPNVIFSTIIVLTVLSTFLCYMFSVFSFNVLPNTSMKVKSILSFMKNIIPAIIFQMLVFFDSTNFQALGFVMLGMVFITLLLVFYAMRQSDFLKSIDTS